MKISVNSTEQKFQDSYLKRDLFCMQQLYLVHCT